MGIAGNKSGKRDGYSSPVGVPQAWLSSILTPRELGCNLGPAKLAELRLMVPCILG